jgi:uncharacterized membrane protein
MDYLIAKWLHILSSTLLFGTGIGSAWYMLTASLSRDARAVAVVVRNVVIADWLFTTTTIVFQPLSGAYLMHAAGVPVTARWIVWSIALYIVGLVAWLPVVALQIRMKKLAADAVTRGEPLPPRYFRLLEAWIALGVPAFFAFVGVFWLMVLKPS